MQVVSPPSPAPKFVGKDRFVEVYGKLSDDFGSKLKMEEEEENRDDNNNNLEESWWNHEEEEEEEEEFSFTNLNAEKSPISAEEAFEDGQIRPVYPLFNRDLLFEKPLRSPLKKVFVESEEAAAEEEESEEPSGPFCSWSGRTVEEEASPETCRKSNSTGFSKLRRFRDLVLRSNSDGRDAFVFFNADKNNQSSSSSSSSSSRLSGVKEEEKGKEEKTTTVERKKKRTKLSAHERLYMRNRALKEEGKRRSYLPYKHVGFFTNVNGLTRNVHPY